MILDEATNKLEISGGSTSSTFGIAVNGKAFRVLSSNLYSNKIGSIVREISTNAYDSHVVNGNPEVPFEIHLPDAFNPWFSVKDFGTGMSSSDITSVFVSYFTSTKDQSNDCTGMLGLGSKSPFSYTDQFTVTSIKDGTRKIYSAFIADNGVPNITEMFSSETTEQNGVEIKLSVKREDYAEFTKEVKEQLKYFKVQPKIINGSIPVDPKVEYVIDSPNIRINKESKYNSEITLVQGVVGYPLDVAQISKELNPKNRGLLNNIKALCPVIYFNIGEISVTASRESVEYTNTTIKNICNKLDLVYAELELFVKSRLHTLSTDWEKAKFLSSNSVLNRMVPSIQIKNASNIGNSYWQFDIKKLFTIKTPTDDRINIANTAKISGITLNKALVRRYTTFSLIADSTKSLVVLKDKATFCSEKYKLLFDQGYQNIIEIETTDKLYDQTLVDKIKDHLGGFNDVIMLSSVVLPKKEKTSYQRGSVSKTPSYYEHNNESSVRNWDKKYDKLKDITGEVLYVVIDGLSLVSFADNYSIASYKVLSEIEPTPRLITVRAKQKDTLGPNFVELKDYIFSKKKQLTTDELQRDRNTVQLAIEAESLAYMFNSKSAVFQEYCKETEVARLLKIKEKLSNKRSNIYTKYKSQNNFNNISTFTGVKANVHAAKRINNAILLKNKALSKYTLLNAVINSYGLVEKQEVYKHLAIYCKALYEQTKISV